MARVGKIKYQFLGVDKEIPVNCGSAGIFTCNVPGEVAKALQIGTELSASTLKDLESQFFAALKTFKDSTKTEELLICINYKATGRFNSREDGSILFGGYRNKYSLEISSWDHIDAIGFEHNVIIKETINAKHRYYEAKKGEPSGLSYKDDEIDLNKWYKHSEFSVRDGSKLIPYSDEANSTLMKARESLRKISEMLFDFIEKEPYLIEAQLKSLKLIN